MQHLGPFFFLYGQAANLLQNFPSIFSLTFIIANEPMQEKKADSIIFLEE